MNTCPNCGKVAGLHFFVPLFWLMIPLAFIVVVFDVAKSFVEDRVEAKFKEKNT